jgi:hypothetical protein
MAAQVSTGGWDFLVSKGDLAKAEVRPRAPQPLTPGEARLAVESFALTANNITYGAMGDSFGYWKFFPAPEGFGRIPVWGYATVTESANPDIAVGQRIFGYLPMSTDFTARLERRGNGFVDAAAHRAELPPTYNQYQAVAGDDGLGDHRSLLRPLFMTSWLLDDYLAEAAGDLKTVILSSASSKTALGLGWLLARRGVKVVGLTSPGNADFLKGLGFFDQVVTYDAIPQLAVESPAALVDFAGNPAVMGAVHHRLGEGLALSAIVGATHWDVDRTPGGGPLPGPTPTLFFAPDQIRKRMAEWGGAELDRRFAEALKAFVADNAWLTLTRHKGPEGLKAAYAEVLEGRSDPRTGHIIAPA